MNRQLHPVFGSGFSFIELLIVVAIIGILTLIVLPSYTQHLISSRRAEAKVALMEVSSRQEQYILDHQQYSLVLKSIGLSKITPEGNYLLAISPSTQSCPISYCYELTATIIPTAKQAKDIDCSQFILKSSGLKKAQGINSLRCWL